MREEMFSGSHDRRHARFIVGAKQRSTRRRDDVVPDLRRQLGPVRRPQHRRWIVGQHDVVAGPVAMHEWCDPGAAHFRRGIHVRQEPDGWRGNAGRGGDGREQVAVLVACDVGQPEFAELASQVIEQHELSRRRRHRCGGLIGASIERDVSKEAIEHRHRRSGEQSGDRCESARWTSR